MFLGLDEHETSIYYLTTKKMANLSNPCVDASEARFSSPSLVKKISYKQLTQLKSILT